MSQKRSKQTLLDFNFLKKPKTITSEEPSTSTSTCCNLETAETELKQCQQETHLASHVPVPSIHDVGLYIGKSLDDDLKYDILNSPWVPEINFNFPKIGMFFFSFVWVNSLVLCSFNLNNIT